MKKEWGIFRRKYIFDVEIHFWCRENTFAQPLHGQGGRECVWGSGLIQIKWGVFSTNTQGKVNLMLYIQVNVQEIWRNSTFFIVFWWLGVHLKKLRETGEGLGLAVAWNVESLLFLSCSKKTSEWENQVETLKRDKARISGWPCSHEIRKICFFWAGIVQSQCPVLRLSCLGKYVFNLFSKSFHQ